MLSNPLIYLFLGIAGSHALANSVFSWKIARERGLSLFPLLVPTFLLLHVSYGLGSLWGIWKVFQTRSFQRSSLAGTTRQP
jgi:hypothetical protein